MYDYKTISSKEEAKALMDNDAAFRNTQLIINSATRVIRGKVPFGIRAELNAAVKWGLLGHLKKDGLKPEIYYNVNHKWSAVDMQNRQALAAVGAIAKVMANDPAYSMKIHHPELAAIIEGL